MNVDVPLAIVLAPQSVLAERYRILGPLGKGGMAVVYDAFDEKDKRRVAVKVLTASSDRKLRQRFEIEARACMRLTSRYVVQLFDMGHLANDMPFLVFERMYGCELASEIASRVIATEEIVDWALDASDAIAEAHARSIVHRDLKPNNLFVCDHPKRRFMKVLDFGVSKLVDGETSSTGKGSVLGTPLYMAPEHLKGDPTTPSSDQFSFAVVIYEAITGRLPFHGTTNSEYMLSVVTANPLPLTPRHGTLPPGLEAVLARALSKFPDERYPSIADLADALRPFESGKRDPADDGLPTGVRIPVAEVSLPVSSKNGPVPTERWGAPGEAKPKTGPAADVATTPPVAVAAPAPQSPAAIEVALDPAIFAPTGPSMKRTARENRTRGRKRLTRVVAFGLAAILAAALGVALGGFGVARMAPRAKAPNAESPPR